MFSSNSLQAEPRPMDVLSLGESMLRFSAPAQDRLESAAHFEFFIGGAESNVAIGLAHLGSRSAWWSRLPDNPLGHKVANFVQSHGVDVSGVAWADASERVGSYFVEFGNPPRPTQVIYDRANSAASRMTPADFDWTRLTTFRHIHLTGITPALSGSCLKVVQHIVEAATSLNISLSLDLNYRAKLWTASQAAQTLDPLIQHLTWLIAAERDLKTVFALTGEAEKLLANAHARWQGVGIIMTSSAKGSYGIDRNGQNLCHVPAFTVSKPIPIGAGDAFAAGWLCAMLEKQPLADSLRFANAVAALKLTMPGDVAVVSRAEVEALLASSANQAVQR